MRKLLFTRNANQLDVFSVALGTAGLTHGHWIFAVIVIVCGVVASVEGEASLARSQAKWS